MSEITHSGQTFSLRGGIFVLLLALALVSFSSTLAGIYDSWNSSTEMSHGLLVVPLVLALIYLRREDLRRETFETDRLGLLGGLCALVLHPLSIAVQNQFLGSLSLFLFILSLLMALWGRRILVVLAGPLLLLAFAIQPPVILYESLTVPLQYFASASGELILELLGFTVLRQGNILQLPGFTLSVADACSGLASLYSMTFLSAACVVYAGFSRSLALHMAVAAFVVSLVANTGRIILTAILGTYRQDWTQGQVHESVGMATFLIGAAFLIAWFLYVQRRKAAPTAPAH